MLYTILLYGKRYSKPWEKVRNLNCDVCTTLPIPKITYIFSSLASPSSTFLLVKSLLYLNSHWDIGGVQILEK